MLRVQCNTSRVRYEYSVMRLQHVGNSVVCKLCLNHHRVAEVLCVSTTIRCKLTYSLCLAVMCSNALLPSYRKLVQQGEDGHSPIEDAATCMDLLHHKLSKGTSSRQNIRDEAVLKMKCPGISKSSVEFLNVCMEHSQCALV